ncbi:ribose-phosphate pyrophosphokinase [Pseudomonas phage COT4]|uniref:Ribose-phosphate pyrophosphokinase n=1 Tax=Pseudomonas phage M5.1 TaxID=2873460 RepID=A0AAE9BPD3_9CAUD|nr:ribose-phosphate pyrophosphokinase [Pseudomonas phage M5.1]UAV89629.1 ribose-phosphate pyrophosphokinase [Pseudomonas phage M5.1]UGL61228.1 ribose-phosphate pyrophosphokinase [Pseudomonas phage COT4]
MTDFNENLYYSLDGQTAQRTSISTMTFPGGEVGVNINTGSLDAWMPQTSKVRYIDLFAKIQNSDQLMAMFLATDALRRVYPYAAIDLTIPYFPYARQDRVCNAGEALSVKVIATLINAMKYASVTVVDPHSPVLVAALDKVFVVEQSRAFQKIKQDWHNWTIIAPDAGAAKKTEEFAKLVGAKNVLYFSKNRELSTGRITGMKMLNPEILTGEDNLLVLDDICDGGRTFVELAQVFDVLDSDGQHINYNRLELAVTHGIFSKGVSVLTSVYDHVYTTDTLPQKAHSKLTVVNL